ncbi:MAG: hypothetical protein ACOC0L_00325, partial [bacterium]
MMVIIGQSQKMQKLANHTLFEPKYTMDGSRAADLGAGTKQRRKSNVDAARTALSAAEKAALSHRRTILPTAA